MGTRNNLFSLLLMPSRMPEASLDLGHIDRLLKDKLRPISSGGWNFEYDVHHFGIISSSDKEITDNTEFRDDQVIRAANSRILIGHDAPRLLPGGEEAKVLWIPVRRLELSTIACLLKFFDLYRAIGVSMPWIVNLALLNLGYSGARSEDLLIHSDGEQIFNGRDIAPDPVLISDEAQAVNGHALARTLKPIFDRIWRPLDFLAARISSKILASGSTSKK